MATYYTPNLIPDMTSNTAPSGTASASTEFSSTYAAWKGFDGSTSSFWNSTVAGVAPCWLEYEFDSAIQINKYTVSCRTDVNNGAPNTWEFQAYNGATWDTLDSQSSITWTVGEKKEYTFSNSTEYTKYRIYITANNGRSSTSIAEMEMMKAVDTEGTTCTDPTITGTDEFGSINYLTKHDTSPARTFKSGNIVERSDGKILVTYSVLEEQKHYISWVDTEADLYTEDNILTNETQLGTFLAGDGVSAVNNSYARNLSYLFKTSTGRLLAFTYDGGNSKDATGAGTDGTPVVVKVYESINGLGTDFSLVTTIYTSSIPAFDNAGQFYNRTASLGIVQEFEGRLFITFGSFYVQSGGVYNQALIGQQYVSYSDDDGDTWVNNSVWEYFTTAPLNTNARPTSGISKHGNTLLLPITYGSSNHLNKAFFSTDNGESWYLTDEISPTGDIVISMYTSTDGYSYIVYYESTGGTRKVYRKKSCEVIDLDNCLTVGASGEWDGVYRDTTIGDDDREYIFEAPSTNLIYAGDNDGTGSGFFYYTTDRTVTTETITAGGIYQTTATIFICDFQGTTSAETGTVEGSITVTAHGLNADDFIVNTTQNNTSRRILSTTTDTMTVVSISGQTVSDEIRTYAFTDHTCLLKEQSLSVNKKIQEDTEARFTLICDPTYIPRAGQYVKINTNSQHVFTGFIRSVARRLPQNGIDTKIFCDCDCITLNAIPPRRTLDIAYETGTTASDIVESLVNDFLVAEGVASGTIDQGVVLSDDWYDDSLSIGDILDSLADQSGYQWMIDKNFDLQFYQDPTTVSTYSATISDLTTSTFTDFRNVTINETIDNYNNKAFYVGNTDDYGNIIIVSQETTASILETQDYAAGTGVYGVVIRDSNLTEHEFYVAGAGTTVDTIVATGIHDVVDVGDLVNNVDLDERRNVISVTTDTLTLASAISGQTQGQTIATYQQINDIVDNHLKRQDQIPRRLEFDTFTTDFEAGQKLNVVLSKLSATTTETYVIDEVSIQDRGAGYFVAHIVADKRNADNFSTQRTPNYKDYYRQF